MPANLIARSLRPFDYDVFTEMTLLSRRHQAVNLGQGFPDFAGPDFVKEAAIAAIRAGHDQYAPTGGIPALGEAIAAYLGAQGLELDPASEITVTCGCQEALAATFLGLLDPGDEVIVFQPFFDTYPPCIVIPGGIPRYVTLRPPGFGFDEEELRRAFGPRTRAILVNTPHNPTGKVFQRQELELIASLCREHDAVAVMDEVYERLVYGSAEHLRMATLPGMRERTVTLSSLAKTFSLTGWKIGWAVAPPPLTAGIRRAHRSLTFSTATPLQHGAAAALGAPPSYFAELRAGYARRRELLVGGLAEIGFEVFPPDGSYFVLADHRHFGFADDRAFCRYLVEEVGVAAIPPSYFYAEPSLGRDLVRFAFCKSEEVLEQALTRLSRLRSLR